MREGMADEEYRTVGSVLAIVFMEQGQIQS